MNGEDVRRIGRQVADVSALVICLVLLALSLLSLVAGCSFSLHLGGKYYRCDDRQRGGVVITVPDDASGPGASPGAVPEDD